MLYWLTGTAGSSARLYYEFDACLELAAAGPRARRPGSRSSRGDIAPPVRRLAERGDNIVHWSEFDRGGHFAALEQPDLLVADVRAFFRTVNHPGPGPAASGLRSEAAGGATREDA